MSRTAKNDRPANNYYRQCARACQRRGACQRRDGKQEGKLGLLDILQIVADGAEDKAGEHSNVPQAHEEPEGIIDGRASREVGEI